MPGRAGGREGMEWDDMEWDGSGGAAGPVGAEAQIAHSPEQRGAAGGTASPGGGGAGGRPGRSLGGKGRVFISPGV